MEKNPICHEDGTEMVRDVRPVEFSYKGQTMTVAMPGWYCPKCGEGLYTRADMKISDRALNAMKARCEGLLDGPQVKRIRKKLGLTQAAAGDLIGGGPKAFTKYEKGDALTSRAVTNLLKVLDAVPDALTILRDNQGRPSC